MGRTPSGDAGGINIANSLRPNYVFITAAFRDFPDTRGYIDYDSAVANDADNKDGADEAPGAAWRVDGAHFGVRYQVAPLRWGTLTPSRIDLCIPDQTEWPPDCWSRFDARDSVHMSRERVKKLGITHHLIKALTHCEDRDPYFRQQYESLPFGSSLRFPSIELDVADMHIEFDANWELATRLFSAKQLQQIWGLDDTVIPPCLDFRQLVFHKSLAGAITLVSLPDDLGKQIMIFKSERSTPAIVYHELKILLKIPPMGSIVESPQYLVTTGMPAENPGVCGFLLPYYELGDLDRGLVEMRLSNQLSLSLQMQWATDLTAALQHVSTNGYFYSDLRMDNVLLRKASNGMHTAVLTDFQQSRNIYNWAPPEIYWVEWIAELGAQGYKRIDEGCHEKGEYYLTLLHRYLKSRNYHSPVFGPPPIYDNPAQGWYFPWLSSTYEEREAGMVYLLGKALWCIFEGMGDADIVLGRSNPHETEQRFPEFRRTPSTIQSLIKECTAGAREFIDGPIKIYRQRGKIFPLHQTGTAGEYLASSDETKAAIKAFWRGEIVKAEAFISARTKYQQGIASSEEIERWLHYLRRPKLEEVSQRLRKFECLEERERN